MRILNRVTTSFILFFAVILTAPLPAAPPFPGLFDRPQAGGRLTAKGRTVKRIPEYSVPSYGATATSGTVKVAVLSIEFQDVRYDTSTHTSTYFNNLLFSASNPGSMYNYFKENSNGKLLISSGTQTDCQWVRSDHIITDYSTDTDTEYDAYYAKIYKLVQEAVIKMDATFDFSEYDQNGDGTVDHLIVVHAGDAQEKTGNKDHIWSHRWEINGGLGPGYLTNDGVYVKGYTLQAESSPMGIFAHEFSHDLGLPDLYDSETGRPMVAGWCLMDQGAWLGLPAGSNPSHLSAWCKMYLGWMQNMIHLNVIGSQEIFNQENQASGSQKNMSRIDLLGDVKEYLLLEYRKKDASTAFFDKDLPASGVLAWHIDENVMQQMITVDGVTDTRLAQNRVNTESQHHKAVELIEASGPDKSFTAGSMFSNGFSASNLMLSDRTKKNDDTVTAATVIFSAGATPDSKMLNVSMFKMSDQISLREAYAYPNPWRPSSGAPDIKMALRFTRPFADARLYIYTLTGEEVAALVVDTQDYLYGNSTDYEFRYLKSWDLNNRDGSPVSSGIYFYRFVAPGLIKAGKFAVIR